MPSNHFILCHSLLLPPSIFPRIRVFSNESVLHIRWPKYWTFSFSISPSNEYSGLISFRMDWLILKNVNLLIKGLTLLENRLLDFFWIFLSFRFIWAYYFSIQSLSPSFTYTTLFPLFTKVKLKVYFLIQYRKKKCICFVMTWIWQKKKHPNPQQIPLPDLLP